MYFFPPAKETILEFGAFYSCVRTPFENCINKYSADLFIVQQIYCKKSCFEEFLYVWGKILFIELSGMVNWF